MRSTYQVMLGRVSGLFCALLLACVFASSASADQWYAKWSCGRPCVVTVNYSAMPAGEQATILAEMNEWNATGVVEVVPTSRNGMITVQPCAAGSIISVKGFIDTECGFLTYPMENLQKQQLRSVTTYISDQWFGWSGLPLVYCHELGIGLGIMDGSQDASTSCVGGVPDAADYALIAQLYG